MFGAFAHLLYLFYSLSNLGRFLAADVVTYSVLSYPKISSKSQQQTVLEGDDNKFAVQLDIKVNQNITNLDLTVQVVPAQVKCFEVTVVESNFVAERLFSALLLIDRLQTNEKACTNANVALLNYELRQGFDLKHKTKKPLEVALSRHESADESFSFAAGSCSRSGSQSPVFD